MSILRSEARNLSANAARVGARVLGGQLVKEGDHFVINKTDVTKLLETLTDQNVILIVSQVRDEKKEQVKTCLTCGRNYTGPECPHCAQVRARLRGDDY
jgi:hypothetical protein